MDWDSSFNLITEFASEGREGVGAYVVTARYLSELEEFKLFSQRLNDLEVCVHSVVSDIVVSMELTSDEL